MLSVMHTDDGPLPWENRAAEVACRVTQLEVPRCRLAQCANSSRCTTNSVRRGTRWESAAATMVLPAPVGSTRRGRRVWPAGTAATAASWYSLKASMASLLSLVPAVL